MKPVFVLRSHTAADSTQVSVQKDDIVTLVSDNKNGWCTVRANGATGLVPSGNLEGMPNVIVHERIPSGEQKLEMIGNTMLAPSLLIAQASTKVSSPFQKLKRRLSTQLDLFSSSPTKPVSPTTSLAPPSPRLVRRASEHVKIPEMFNPSNQREQIIREIRETEKTYLDGLHNLTHVYLNELISNSLIPIREIESCLSIIGIIVNVNSKLFEQLCDSDSIGKIFLGMTPFLKTYTDYLQKYDAVTALIKNEKQNAKFSEWLKQTEKKCKNNGGATLADYLISPVQRIPRYSLLLKELLKNTDQSNEDYENIAKALEAVLAISNFLNTKMFEKNARKKLKRLFTILSEQDRNSILKPYRKFVFDGFLEVTASTDEHVSNNFLNVNLYVILLSDILVACELVDESEQYLKCLAFTLELDNLENIRGVDEIEAFFEPGDQELMFRFDASSSSTVVRCDTREERQVWKSKFEQVATELKEKQK